MHSVGLKLKKLTYTRLEDNLIRHRGDRMPVDPTRPVTLRLTHVVRVSSGFDSPRDVSHGSQSKTPDSKHVIVQWLVCALKSSQLETLSSLEVSLGRFFGGSKGVEVFIISVSENLFDSGTTVLEGLSHPLSLTLEW